MSRRLIKVAAVSGGLSLLVNSWFVVAQWRATAADGDDRWLSYVMPLVFLLLAALIAVPVALLCSIGRRLRATALAVAAGALVYVGVGVLALRAGGEVREAAFASLAERSVPLVGAIQRYAAEHGQPPTSLQALVPRYLPRVPGTGMAAYPTYDYVAGDVARAGYHGNDWILLVRTPSGPLNWDIFVFYPRLNYPRAGHGGSLERIGTWAYVHE